MILDKFILILSDLTFTARRVNSADVILKYFSFAFEKQVLMSKPVFFL